MLAFDSQGNLEADLQSGIQAGNPILWVLLWSTILGCLFQILALRSGIIGGRSLAHICRDEYPPVLAYSMFVAMELAIITSDVQEVVGSAIAFNILTGLSSKYLWIGVLITALDTFTLLALEKLGMQKLEAFFAVLVGTMAVSFMAVFALSNPDNAAIAEGTIIPSLPKGTALVAVGILGSIIMPHNLFLHSSLVRSRRVYRSSKANLEEASAYFSIETCVSLFVSFIINLTVLGAFAKAFYDPHQDRKCPLPSDPNFMCKDVGLSQAHLVLDEHLGSAGKYLWGVGLLAAGQSSTMTGTYAGQAVFRGFFDLDLPLWQSTLITRSVALIPSMVVALAFADNMDTLNQWINVAQSVLLPFAVVPLVRITNSTTIMGPYANQVWVQVLLWALTAMILGFNIYSVVAGFDWTKWSTYVGTITAGLIYSAAVGYMIWVEPGHGAGLAARGADTNMFKMSSKQLKSSKFYAKLQAGSGYNGGSALDDNEDEDAGSVNGGESKTTDLGPGSSLGMGAGLDGGRDGASAALLSHDWQEDGGGAGARAGIKPDIGAHTHGSEEDAAAKVGGDPTDVPWWLDEAAGGDDDGNDEAEWLGSAGQEERSGGSGTGHEMSNQMYGASDQGNSY